MVRDIPYDIELYVGPYSWVFNQGDTLSLPAPVDGMQMIVKLVESDLWPPPEDVRELKLQLVAAQASDLVLNVGDVVHMEFDSEGADEDFSGRIGEVSMGPHEQGVVYSLSCLDYKADLRELEVGTVAYPAESVQARVERIFAELGQPLTIGTFAGTAPIDVPPLAARAAAPAKAYDLVNHYLNQWPMFYEAPVGVVRGPWRAVLDFDVDAVGNLTTWRVEAVAPDPPYDGVLKLEDVGGLATAVPDTNLAGTALTGIDGGQVDWSSSYAVTKADVITDVTINGDGTGAPFSAWATLGATPAVVASLDSVELSDTADYLVLAGMYLPAFVPVSAWVADEFLWLRALSATADRADVGQLRGLLLVGNLDASRNPNGDAWYAGLLTSYTLTVANKRPTYTFQLRRPSFSTAEADDILRWNSAALAGLTWADLNPADSWDDYRLVRGT